MQHQSTASRIRARFDAIVDQLATLVHGLRVESQAMDHGPVVFIRPDYSWAELGPHVRGRQIELKRDYLRIVELIRVMMRSAPEDMCREFEEADKRFRTWLELGENWALRAHGSENARNVRDTGAHIHDVLDVLDNTGGGDSIVIPDTNALLAESDPTKYAEVAGSSQFRFVLLPTVLAELDKLKVEHRNPEVREKAGRVISRVKGWRRQGALSEGVTVAKSIVVRAGYAEPVMSSSLSWLDATNPDDRIIAGVLELQSQQPAARIVLVTGDINLQNKADAALIEIADLEVLA